MKTILVMCLADISRNPRPNRLVKLLLKQNYIVDTLSYESSNETGVRKKFIISPLKISLINKFTKFVFYMLYWLYNGDSYRDYISNKINFKFNRKLNFIGYHYDLIIVEDLFLLPFAFERFKSTPILFDAREYYPKQNEDSLKFNILERPNRVRLCDLYLKKCSSIITVSDGLAKKFYEDFNVICSVILSTPHYHELSVVNTDINSIKMVHHGLASRNRRLENMIDVFKHLDSRFTLDFYLTGNSKYINFLKSYASAYPNIKFCDPVPLNSIVKMLNSYDIGLYYLEPTGFNVTFNLPNKFFEFIQAKLMVAIGPSPEMRNYVSKYNLGIYSDEFNLIEFAKKLNSLTPIEIDKYKYNSYSASSELSFESQSVLMSALILNTISKSDLI